MADQLKPKDHAEAVALFRSQVIGPLVCRSRWHHGELAEALREIATQAVRPPGTDLSRYYAASTLERWLYSYRSGGLEALKPDRRSDSGHARSLTEEQRELLLAIRRENPRASAALILRTLIEDGRLSKSVISDTTLRRLYNEHGLSRQMLRDETHTTMRLRWQAPRPNVVWHADVLHGPALKISDKKTAPLRIHAIMDDHSRYVVAIQACATEREQEMLALLVRAIRSHGAPGTLYLDNGPTYVGDTLRTACGRLDIALVHAKPYDASARGKMERLWRTLREQCLDHMGPMSSLHDVQVRLLAWLERHYLVAPHASHMGRSPTQIYEEGLLDDERSYIDEDKLREALTIRARRRVRKDGTLSVAGICFELKQGYLAGQLVTVARSLIDPTTAPWVEHDEQRLSLQRVDPVANSQRRRDKRPRRGIDAIPFDPPGALLEALKKKGGRR